MKNHYKDFNIYLKGLQNRENSKILEYKTPIVSPEKTAGFLINLTNEIK